MIENKHEVILDLQKFLKVGLLPCDHMVFDGHRDEISLDKPRVSTQEENYARKYLKSVPLEMANLVWVQLLASSGWVDSVQLYLQLCVVEPEMNEGQSQQSLDKCHAIYHKTDNDSVNIELFIFTQLSWCVMAR